MGARDASKGGAEEADEAAGAPEEAGVGLEEDSEGLLRSMLEGGCGNSPWDSMSRDCRLMM